VSSSTASIVVLRQVRAVSPHAGILIVRIDEPVSVTFAGATRRARPRSAHSAYGKSVSYDLYTESPHLFYAENLRFLSPHLSRQSNRLRHTRKTEQISASRAFIPGLAERKINGLEARKTGCTRHSLALTVNLRRDIVILFEIRTLRPCGYYYISIFVNLLQLL
jgi:hypothetical protein